MSWRRLLAGGILVAALTGCGGGVLEWWRFGTSQAAAAARVERELHDRFRAMVQAITGASETIARDPRTAAALTGGQDAARTLFDLAADTRRGSRRADEMAITVYDQAGVARAWAGAPSDLPVERISGSATLFVTPSPLGLRLVHLRAITDAAGTGLGAIASEHVLSRAPAATALSPADYRIDTAVGPVSLRTRGDGAGEPAEPGTIVLRGAGGEPLAEAWMDPSMLRDARRDWRRSVLAAMLAVVGVTVLLLVGPLLDQRVAADRPGYVRSTLVAALLILAGGALLYGAVWQAGAHRPHGAVSLLFGGGTAAALVALLTAPVNRLRIALRSYGLTFRPTAGFLLTHLVAGLAVALLLIGFYRLLAAAVDPVAVDLRHFSLHPWSTRRVLLLAAIVTSHLAAVWAATLVLVAAAARRRVASRSRVLRGVMLGLWLAPSAAAAFLAGLLQWAVPPWALVLGVVATGAAAVLGARVARWYRHATVAARIFALFLAFLVPTLLLYPGTHFFAERATRDVISREYAVQAQNHVQTLLRNTEQARQEVDAMATLPELVSGPADPEAPDITAAFLVWRQTALARERLTSAVELYDAAGELVSRFALNVPEYTASTVQSSAGCEWDVFVEVSPFGSEERRMLHAERRVCTREPGGRQQVHGAIILHVLFEYETLPFITSQNPYYEVVRTAGTTGEEANAGGHVDVAIYGWGLQPIYTSGRPAWPITDAVFARLYASREPFWSDAAAAGARYQVYFSNDRERIFAIGYPVPTVFDHFVHLAELTTFGAVAFIAVLLGTAAFTRIARQRPRVGRALLREIRASFYRKLFLAFVLAAIIPVVTLALVIRAYFANLLQADVEAEAARTAAIAQRVIEDLDIGLRRSAEASDTLSDDWMVWISQVIDQDVNVFRGARLAVTSERALFASGVLPTRTPDDVYRSIVLQRLPSFVREDAIGGFNYMLAAAPVRAAGPDVLVTVPLTLRQREIEREIDELDRGVHLASLFFVLLGAGIGLSMAERIADPVRRLTRATGQIARGDFDARIAVRSADELRRLVDAFNSMAEELKAQRTQLERTHRLEAWAEMARQVAHEIKNPLTPIQLSAEHLQRVHADRGEPMGPVLESCVASILTQVRLLRQISSEFSSFASSPTARRAPVAVPELVAEIVDPYRTGLQGRIDIQNRVPAELPLVLVDRTLTGRALSNVVENALYAMPGRGRLTIEAEVEEGAVRLEVADTGAGMDEEALARVFEPYFSTKATGTGLGLPIARRNIELNGGSVDVRSAKGVGTTVTVRLPLVPDADGPQA